MKTPAMEYGTLHEDEDAQQYSATYNITIYPVGFVINPSRSYLGCFPDRRVCDSSNVADPVGLLEVKGTMRDSVADQCNFLEGCRWEAATTAQSSVLRAVHGGQGIHLPANCRCHQ